MPSPSNGREFNRIPSSLPIQLKFGSQITLAGVLKDISIKSAFIKIKESVYLQPNDEVDFSIINTRNGVEEAVTGSGRISRIAAGEGIAIYFTQMDADSSIRLKELLEVR